MRDRLARAKEAMSRSALRLRMLDCEHELPATARMKVTSRRVPVDGQGRFGASPEGRAGMCAVRGGMGAAAPAARYAGQLQPLAERRWPLRAGRAV